MRFKIKKGDHSCFHLFRLHFSNTLNFQFKLVGDFTYKSSSKAQQEATNKIYGLSDSYFHQRDSIRIGYRYFDKRLELRIYYYNDGIHTSRLIGYIEVEQTYDIMIQFKKGKYVVRFNNVNFEFPRTSNWFLPRYTLYPYFGGNDTAHKDLVFEINKKKPH